MTDGLFLSVTKLEILCVSGSCWSVLYTQFFRNVERPDGVTHWSARFQAQLLFPQYEGEKK
jgi:hypothetical protein